MTVYICIPVWQVAKSSFCSRLNSYLPLVSIMTNKLSLLCDSIADINECIGVNNCEQECINKEGSYECSCREGFQLAGDGQQCIGKLQHIVCLENLFCLC